MKPKQTLMGLSIAATLSLTGCGSSGGDTDSFTMVKDMESAQKASTIQMALSSYATYAISHYQSALNDAKAMQSALATFTQTPTADTLQAAKDAWLQARESYGVTEILRLSNGPIDAEEGFAASFGAPEGQLNAWPLDENMIDYTKAADGTTTSGNIIDTAGSFTPSGGTEVNTTTITKEVLAQLNENGGDANVATGYHAIEFLLWGQDQDYASFVADNVTHGQQTAGQRPLADYTSDTHAPRRKAYLNAAADLIVDDLQSLLDAWQIGGYKEALLGEGAHAITQTTALKQIFGGMGVFLKSELANERIAVAALTPNEEDEHSCFSDNTHRDIALNYEGFKAVLALFGEYLSGDQKAEIASLESSIDAKVQKINETATGDGGYHFDYQIVAANGKLQNIVDAKNEMRDLGDEMISVAAEYGITLTEGDVTDSGETQI